MAAVNKSATKTTAKKTTKTQQPDDDRILSLYMEDVLSNGKDPVNVFQFCQRHAIDETVFYTFFNSLPALRREIWVKFFENAEAVLNKNTDYAAYSQKDKLLALYFTLFEIFTLNRSYVSWTLRDNGRGLRNLDDLKMFRNHFRDFCEALLQERQPDQLQKLRKITEPVLSEAAWVQFLFVLKYWLDDTSKGFEKTDIVIEKSVNTVVSLLDTKPLENLVDLGKFLWRN